MLASHHLHLAQQIKTLTPKQILQRLLMAVAKKAKKKYITNIMNSIKLTNEPILCLRILKIVKHLILTDYY